MVPGAAAVPTVWKEQLGAEYHGASKFLRPTLHHAEAYPCPSPGGDGCPRRVVRHAGADIVAVCGDDPKRCESIRLTPQEVTLLEIDLNGLAKEIVSGLGVSWQTFAMTPAPGVYRIGSYTQSFNRHLPVYLLLRQSAEDVRQSAQDFAVGSDASSIVLVPTQAWADKIMPALARSGSVLIALDDILALTDGGHFERLGKIDEVLGKLGPDVASGGGGGYVFRRQGEKWNLSFGGGKEPFFLDDVVGLSYISVLLASPGKEFSVVELAKACGSGGGGAGLGSAGEMLDAQAIGEYRGEKKELEGDLEEARKNGDLGRQNAIRDDIDAIDQQLAQGVGLGGRLRRAHDDAEKLRKRVSMGIERALDKVKSQNHDMWLHLENSLQRGSTLAYRPDRPIPWES